MIYTIIIIILALLIIVYFLKNAQVKRKIEEYGHTREFLKSIIDSFEEDYPKHDISVSRESRYRATFFAGNHSITIDFNYLPNTIQTYIMVDKFLLGREKFVWTTPYNKSEVEIKLREKLMPGI